MQVQPIEVDRVTQGRVRRVEHLKSAVETKAVDDVGSHPSAHVVARLENGDGQTRVHQVSSACQTREPRSDHDHVDVVVARRRRSRHAPDATGRGADRWTAVEVIARPLQR